MPSIGKKLGEVLKYFNKKQNTNNLYNEDKQTLDLTRILPNKDIEKALGLIDYTNIYGSTIIQKFFDITTQRCQRYDEYEQIYYRIPEAAAALHIYVDLILSPNLGDRHNEIKLNNTPSELGVKAKIMGEIILDKTNFLKILPNIIFTTILYGDTFLEIVPTRNFLKYIIHPPKNVTMIYDKITGIEAGILVLLDQDESLIKKIISKTYPTLNIELPRRTVAVASNINSYKNSEDFYSALNVPQIEDLIKNIMDNEGVKYRYIPPGKYTHFPIYYNNMYYPYGTSLYDPIRSMSKQLLLLEAALSIFKITRAPVRFKYKVEVGTTPESKIRTLLEGIKNRIKKNKVVDFDNGISLDTIPDILSPEEDLWIPTINGTPMMDAEILDVGGSESYTNDVEYFKKKLIGSLGIPPAYLAEEQGSSTRALLTLEDIRFSRTIKKYQSDINIGLNSLINNCFYLLNFNEYVNQLEILLPQPQNVEDNIRVENLSNKIGVADNLLTLFPNIPKLWILKNIIGLTDLDIEDMMNDVSAQKDIILFNEQKPGEIKSEGDLENNNNIDIPIGDNTSSPFDTVEDMDNTGNENGLNNNDESIPNLSDEESNNEDIDMDLLNDNNIPQKL